MFYSNNFLLPFCTRFKAPSRYFLRLQSLQSVRYSIKSLLIIVIKINIIIIVIIIIIVVVVIVIIIIIIIIIIIQNSKKTIFRFRPSSLNSPLENQYFYKSSKFVTSHAHNFKTCLR